MPVPPVQAAREQPRASQPHPAPPTPLNLALPSPAVRVRLAAKNLCSRTHPLESSLGGLQSPGKCPVLAPHGPQCPTPVVTSACALGKWEGFTGPRSSQGMWGRAENDSPGSRREIRASNKSQFSSATPEEPGIQQAHSVLTFSVLPARLKLGERSSAHLRAHTSPTCVCVLRHGTRMAQVSPWLREHAWAHLGTHLPVPAAMRGGAHVQTRRCSLARGAVCTCVCPVHVCAHTREFWGVGCTHSAWGLAGSACGWPARVWAGVCCAQAPPDGALPPCHLLGTQTCSLRRDIGGVMRGHHPLCQAESPTIARGE